MYTTLAKRRDLWQELTPPLDSPVFPNIPEDVRVGLI